MLFKEKVKSKKALKVAFSQKFEYSRKIGYLDGMKKSTTTKFMYRNGLKIPGQRSKGAQSRHLQSTDFKLAIKAFLRDQAADKPHRSISRGPGPGGKKSRLIPRRLRYIFFNFL